MSENRDLFGIETAARQAGISRKSLQYYVKLRLIEPTEVTATGHLFDKRTVERAKLIKKLNDSGYSLRAIQKLFFEGRFETLYDQSQSFLQPEETMLSRSLELLATSKKDGTLEPKPPEFFQNLLWIWKHGRKHWKLLVVAGLILLIIFVTEFFKEEICTWISDFHQKTISETKTGEDSSPATITPEPNGPVAENYDPPKSKTKQIAEKEFGPSPEEIYKDIESRPLFQQKDARKYYIGSKVKWRLHLISVSISKWDEKTADILMRTEETSNPISCSVEISRYPQLKLVKQDSKIWVSGEINNFEEMFGGIELSNVSLVFESNSTK